MAQKASKTKVLEVVIKMTLNKDDKMVLREMVKHELENLERKQKILFVGMSLSFLKGEHEYKHYLTGLLKKLE